MRVARQSKTATVFLWTLICLLDLYQVALAV